MGSVFMFLIFIVLSLLIYTGVLIQKNRKLLYLAYKDPLTGADNFNCFLERLEEARQREQEFCFAALNIHQFKFINEIFGTETADRILCDISDSISEMMGDGEFYCRENADVFYLFLKETEQTAVLWKVYAGKKRQERGSIRLWNAVNSGCFCSRRCLLQMER